MRRTDRRILRQASGLHQLAQEPVLDSFFIRVAEGRIAYVMQERARRGYRRNGMGIRRWNAVRKSPANRLRQVSRYAADLKRVSQARADRIMRFERKYLCLVLQSADGCTEDDTPQIVFELGSVPGRVVWWPSPRNVDQPRPVHCLQAVRLTSNGSWNPERRFACDPPTHSHGILLPCLISSAHAPQFRVAIEAVGCRIVTMSRVPVVRSILVTWKRKRGRRLHMSRSAPGGTEHAMLLDYENRNAKYRELRID